MRGDPVFDITADAFMRSMIRVLVGTMLEVGGGKRTVEDFAALLDGAPRERAGETAPPHGLYFAGVEYGDGPGVPALRVVLRRHVATFRRLSARRVHGLGLRGLRRESGSRSPTLGFW